MISWFAWRRRLRNIVAAMFGALLLALLLIFVFRAELPDLDWARESARVLSEPRLPIASPAAAPDGGVDIPDAMVTDVGGPTPSPESGESAMARGQRQLHDGDPWQALLAFEEASREEPKSPEPAYYMAVSYVQLGKYEAAVDQFERALKVDPRHMPSMYGYRKYKAIQRASVPSFK